MKSIKHGRERFVILNRVMRQIILKESHTGCGKCFDTFQNGIIHLHTSNPNQIQTGVCSIESKHSLIKEMVPWPEVSLCSKILSLMASGGGAVV